MSPSLCPQVLRLTIVVLWHACVRVRVRVRACVVSTGPHGRRAACSRARTRTAVRARVCERLCACASVPRSKVAYIVMAYIVIAYIVIAYIVMAYIVMAYVLCAPLESVARP